MRESKSRALPTWRRPKPSAKARCRVFRPGPMAIHGARYFPARAKALSNQFATEAATRPRQFTGSSARWACAATGSATSANTALPLPVSRACPQRACSQSIAAYSGVDRYQMQTVEQLVEGAREAHRMQAVKYCMVTATRGPSPRELEIVCEAVRRIKAEIPIKICTSL